MSLNQAIHQQFVALGNEEDFRRGWKDLVVQLRNGDKQVIRVIVAVRDVADRAFVRYSQTMDPLDLLPALLEPQFAKPEFLNSILPHELVRLANVGTALLIGPERLKGLLSQQGFMFGEQN